MECWFPALAKTRSLQTLVRTAHQFGENLHPVECKKGALQNWATGLTVTPPSKDGDPS